MVMRARPTPATWSESLRPGLLSLPPELRLSIYQFVFVAIEKDRTEALKDVVSSEQMQGLFAFGLVHASQLIRAEVIPLFTHHLRQLSRDLHERQIYDVVGLDEGYFDFIKDVIEWERPYKESALWCQMGIIKVSMLLQDFGEPDAQALGSGGT